MERKLIYLLIALISVVLVIAVMIKFSEKFSTFDMNRYFLKWIETHGD